VGGVTFITNAKSWGNGHMRAKDQGCNMNSNNRVGEETNSNGQLL